MHSLTNPDLSSEDLCELATECEGDPVQTVDALIEGVLLRYGDVLDEAAHAALNAVRYYHVPNLADDLKEATNAH